MKPKILFVDDEVANLNQFKANFRGNYEVELAETAEKAESIMSQFKPVVLLADQRLPQKSGVELLAWSQLHHPDTVRILVTGYNDQEPLIEAVNKGHIYYYIQKPWNVEQVGALLKRAVEYQFQQNMIRNQNHDLRRMVTEMERFVYSVSHDIRAPLTSVKGLIELIRLEPDKAPEYLNYMDQSIDRLDVFIHKIIDHYRNNKIEQTIRHIDVEQMLELIVDTQVPALVRNDIEVTIDVESQCPLYSDEFRLNIILGNLISNASKFFKSGQNDKKLHLQATISADKAVFTIADNGIGIPEKHLKSVFNLFYKVATENAGSGLGLYLVNEAVKTLGGQIVVSSEPNHSTTFVVTIPNQPNL